MDSHSVLTLARLHLNQSKTDPFKQGVDVFLGRTGKDLCPVVAILAYVAVRGESPGPLFVFQVGNALNYQCLVSQLRRALQSQAIDQSKYYSHSLELELPQLLRP